MRLTRHQYYFIYLFLALFFYLGFARFAIHLALGSGQSTGFEKAAGGSIANQIIGLLLLGLSIWYFIETKKEGFKQFFRQGWPILFICGLFLLSILWSEVPAITLRRCVALITMVVVAFTLSQVFSARSLFNLLANGICLVVMLGFAYSVLTGGELSFGLGDRESGFRGIFENKNGAARVYAYGLLILVALKRYRSKTDKALIVMLLVAILLSQSASAVMMSLMGIVAIFALNVFKGKDKAQTFKRALVMLLSCSFLAILVISSFEWILELLGRDRNLTNRSIIWELLSPYAAEKWQLGYGFGAFWASNSASDFIERWEFIGNAHSGYFEMILHAGVVGFFLVIVALFITLKRSFLEYLTHIHQERDIFIFALTLFFVQIVTNYIAYIILNHNSFDMFLFSLTFFIVARSIGDKPVSSIRAL